MTEPLESSDPGTQKRRSTRIVQAVPITVTGVDALGQPFKERTTTVMVNCHGCKYQSRHYVPKNTIVTLEIPRLEPTLPSRSVLGRVVWVQRPRTVRELFQIGLEFEVAGNVWGIAFPPEDWFPNPEDLATQISATSEADAAPTVSVSAETKSEASTERAGSVPEAEPAAPPADSNIRMMPSPPSVPAQDAQLTVARQMAKMVAEAKQALDKTLRKGAESAINDEMTIVRQQLDAQLHEAVEKAIKSSMERVSESTARKVVQQAADRTAAIVEEARKASEASASQLDSKVRQAVREAVSHAAEQAAQQAAQQTAAHNLKQAVEEVVERVITERESSTPSLAILSSPEAAEKHLDQWKKELEETAQTVRGKTIEEASAEAAAASRRWQEQFEAALTGASRSLGEKLRETSQAALSQAEQDAASRSASLRASLEEAVAGAQNSIQSLGAGLEKERARTEETKGQLQEAAKSAVEQTRQRLDELLSAHYQEISRKADQVIADRAQQIEPLLEQSASKVVERVTGELDRKLAPKLSEVQKAVSDLTNAGQQAALIRSTIVEQVQQASGQAVQDSLNLLRQEATKIPAEFEQTARAALTKAEQELELRSTETQHETYEALLKASEWYQKKAQTTMQSALEKAVDQSTSTLRDRAAEVSSLVASELDHYRRTYVEHSQAQIEEAAKEVMDRERGNLKETAEIAAASFTDRVQRVTGESLRRFEEASREALEKARSDMEYNREGSLTDFQKALDRRMTEGVEQARTYLQSQLMPLIEAWEANREAEKREWTERLKKSTDESIEQYKARLENASNSWLLASATTLGQHSQTVLDTIAKAADKRLRETCAEVLAGMGDTLKERLLGISGDFGNEDDEDGPPKKKK